MQEMSLQKKKSISWVILISQDAVFQKFDHNDIDTYDVSNGYNSSTDLECEKLLICQKPAIIKHFWSTN